MFKAVKTIFLQAARGYESFAVKGSYQESLSKSGIQDPAAYEQRGADAAHKIVSGFSSTMNKFKKSFINPQELQEVEGFKVASTYHESLRISGIQDPAAYEQRGADAVSANLTQAQAAKIANQGQAR